MSMRYARASQTSSCQVTWYERTGMGGGCGKSKGLSPGTHAKLAAVSCHGVHVHENTRHIWHFPMHGLKLHHQSPHLFMIRSCTLLIMNKHCRRLGRGKRRGQQKSRYEAITMPNLPTPAQAAMLQTLKTTQTASAATLYPGTLYLLLLGGRAHILVKRTIRHLQAGKSPDANAEDRKEKN